MEKRKEEEGAEVEIKKDHTYILRTNHKNHNSKKINSKSFIINHWRKKNKRLKRSMKKSNK